MASFNAAKHCYHRGVISAKTNIWIYDRCRQLNYCLFSQSLVSCYSAGNDNVFGFELILGKLKVAYHCFYGGKLKTGGNIRLLGFTEGFWKLGGREIVGVTA